MGGPSAPQEDPNQAKMEAQQEALFEQQKKELHQRQFDMITRMQGQASTAAGGPTSGTATSGSGTSSNPAPFGISGLFTGSSTIG